MPTYSNKIRWFLRSYKLHTTYTFGDEASLTFDPILWQECPRPGDAVYGEVVLCPREDEAQHEGPVLDQIDEHIEGAVESDEEVWGVAHHF